MRAAALFAFLGMILGCATSKEVFTASGEIGHKIECNGYGLSWGQCFEKAGETCRDKGFDVLEQVGERIDVVSGIANKNSATVNATPMVTRVMIIQCKK